MASCNLDVRHNVRRGFLLAAGLAVAALAAMHPPSVRAQPVERAEETPPELLNVGTQEHLGAPVPLDLGFTDSSGRPVTLRAFFDGRRPVLLTMNYSDCPRLCSLQLNGLFRGLEQLDWSLGEQFQMLTVSIDPRESPERAEATKAKYLQAYGRASGAEGWRCLVGTEENIRRLADAVGFRYAYVEETRQYAHAAVTMVLTPDGRVSRYLYGIEYQPQTLRLALLEASQGKLGTTVDKVILYCFRYDSAAGRYAPVAERVMTVGASLFAALLGGALLAFWGREALRARRSPHPAGQPPAGADDSWPAVPEEANPDTPVAGPGKQPFTPSGFRSSIGPGESDL